MVDFYGNNGGNNHTFGFSGGSPNAGNSFGGGVPNTGNPFGGGYGNGGNPYGGGYGNGGNPYGGGFGGGGNSFGGGMNYNRTNSSQRRETHFGFVLLLASLIGAGIFFLLGEVIYRVLIANVSSILFMGVYFAVFGLILTMVLLIAARICRLEFSAKRLIVSGMCILLLFLLGMLFEFLYEMNFAKVLPVKTSYVFVIDNSGSMQTNDPEQKRVDAIYQLLEDKDESVRFAVYTFSENISCIRKMLPISDGIEDLAIVPNGGTPIVGALTQVMDDMESGELEYDRGTQVILLTDGYATDNGFFGLSLNSVLEKFNKKMVSVSTVGLGDVDTAFLENISSKTGGLSVTTDNVDELGTAMASVVRNGNANRTLLSARSQASLNWLYAILRILFVTILGMIFIGIKIAVTDESTNAKMIIISSVIGCLLGALILEFGLRLILTEFLARLILVPLIALLVTTIEKLVDTGAAYGTLGRL